MPYANIDGLEVFMKTDKHGAMPSDMLPYDKNCVAMSFSRCMGVGVYAAINFFLDKGWISSAADLENDTSMSNVLKGMDMTKIYDHEPWSKVKSGLKGRPDGRYFAVNTGVKDSGFDGHAIAIIKKGALGVVGNNQDTKGSNLADGRKLREKYDAENKEHTADKDVGGKVRTVTSLPKTMRQERTAAAKKLDAVPYHEKIMDTHHISVWGPIAHRT
ncbi:MAG: hypothetical protein AAF479_07965 [Pseudomonadota bacterium]